MAKQDKNAKPAEQPETGNATEAANETKAAPTRDYPTGQELADIVARKQAHGVLGRSWKMKGGTDIPSRFDKAEASQYEAKLGNTSEETMKNMLAFADGDQQAVLDAFNAAHRLAAQKAAKDRMQNNETDLAKVQETVDGFLSGSKRRGTGAGAGAKARAERAETKAKAAEQTASEILAELEAINPEAARKYRERLASLGQ